MILDWLEEWFKGVLIDGITSNLTGLFDTVNTKVGEIAADVGATPQGWNSGIFNMLRNLSETVIVPIAGAILALIMCYELIQLIAERNSMHDMDSWMLFRWVFKSAAAIILVSNTWNIVMGVFDLTQSVVNQSAGVIIGNREVFNMNIRNEIKAQIVRAGMTMQEVVDQLSIDYGWSESVSNLSGKLQRESIRYKEVLELAAVLGYDIVWKKRGER